MAGVWRKTLTYLGLVEDEDPSLEDEDLDEAPGSEPALRPVAGPGRRRRREEAAPAVRAEPETIVRTIQPRSPGSAIHRAEPKRFNEARELGEKFKEGIPVIMNLQQTEDAIARRLVDFASGLVFALDGKIELAANRVYLLTPQDVEVSAEERERIREGGFFNQF